MTTARQFDETVLKRSLCETRICRRVIKTMIYGNIWSIEIAYSKFVPDGRSQALHSNNGNTWKTKVLLVVFARARGNE